MRSYDVIAPFYDVGVGDRSAMAALVSKHRVDVIRHTVKRLAGGGYTVQAVVDDARITALENAGYASRIADLAKVPATTILIGQSRCLADRAPAAR